MPHHGYKVAYIARGMQECVRRAVHASIQRAGHCAVSDPRDADLCVASWLFGSIENVIPSNDCPKVRWYIGTDATLLTDGRTEAPGAEPWQNWATCGHISGDLDRAGVPHRIAPITSLWEPMPLPMPRQKLVLLYCPEGREPLYRWNDLLAVIEQCPDIRFRVFRRTTLPPLPNIEHGGVVAHEDMPMHYAQARAVLRLTTHDGLSHSILEALCFGRWAIWSWPLDGARQAVSAAEAISLLREAVSGDAINHAGLEAMRAHRRAANELLDQAIQEAVG